MSSSARGLWQALAGLAAGLLFGAGLAFGGMTDPAVVQGFLDIAGDWNPSLIGVMGAAVVVTFIGYRLVWRGARPWLAGEFSRIDNYRIDAALILGAALFGVGWGLAGYCPGPALAALPALLPGTAQCVLGMLAGLGLVRLWRAWRADQPTRP